MSAAGVYLVSRLPASVFTDKYLPLMTELVGDERMSESDQEIAEMFASTLASKVSLLRALI